MDIIVYEGITTAVVPDEQVVIREVQDALDLMADARYHGADSVILHANNLDPAFFDLKTRLAGDILQKFSNYRMRLAIVGNFTALSSKSLTDFISESNKFGRINFVASVDEAKEKLARK